eukprot:3462604-Rhodomonas_salina.3
MNPQWETSLRACRRILVFSMSSATNGAGSLSFSTLLAFVFDLHRHHCDLERRRYLTSKLAPSLDWHPVQLDISSTPHNLQQNNISTPEPSFSDNFVPGICVLAFDFATRRLQTFVDWPLDLPRPSELAKVLSSCPVDADRHFVEDAAMCCANTGIAYGAMC